MNDLTITDLDELLGDFHFRARFQEQNEQQADAIISVIRRLRDGRDRVALRALQYMNGGEADA